MKYTYTVFVNGCFDILHIGHIRLLQFAREYGIKQSSVLQCKVVVGLNSDASIIQLKGANRPIFKQGERKEILLALNCVDDVIIFDEKTPDKLIAKIKPNCIVRGPDHLARPNDAIPVVIYDGKKLISTSNIIERINRL